MFGGFGVSADGVNFALALRGAIYLRVNDQTIPQFQAENSLPFQYPARGKIVTVRSYWQLPERLYDDPDELGAWARTALVAAKQASVPKAARKNAATGNIGRSVRAPKP
jgi:DNA transformation protein